MSVIPFGFSRPRASSPSGSESALAALGEISVTCERGKSRYLGVELQFDGASWSVTLFADDNFGFAVDFVCFGLPLVKIFCSDSSGFFITW